VNQTINELSKQLEEQKEINKERLDVIFHLMNKIENLEKEAKIWKIIGLVLVTLVAVSLIGYVVWVKVWKFKI
jgi:cell division septal protein FtsQ